MRGLDIHQEILFSTVIPEQRVPKDHPRMRNLGVVPC